MWGRNEARRMLRITTYFEREAAAGCGEIVGTLKASDPCSSPVRLRETGDRVMITTQSLLPHL